MGRERVELTAHAGLSNHNSAQDDFDARLWNEFIAVVYEGLLRPLESPDS